MTLTNICKVGRYVNPSTGNAVNVHKGQKKGSRHDVFFWLYRGNRQFIGDEEFSNEWRKK